MSSTTETPTSERLVGGFSAGTSAGAQQNRASTGGLPVLAAVIAVTSWSVAVLALVAFFASDAPLDSDRLFFFVDISAAAVYGTVAGIVLSRRIHIVPLVLATTALGCGLAALGYGYEQLVTAQPGLPRIEPLFHLQNTAWIPGTLALFLVVPWLVRIGPTTRYAILGASVGTVVTTYFFVVSVLGWREESNLDTTIALAVIVAVGTVSTVNVVWRWRRGPAEERTGMGWLALGTALMTASFVPLIVPDIAPWLWVATPLMHLAAQAFYPATILIVILRQRMWGLDLVVSRAVVAGTLTVMLVLLYAAIATALAALLPEVGAGFVAAAAVAVAVQPSRLWVQRRVRLLVYGEGTDPSRAVRLLGSQFGSAETVEDLMAGLAAGVGDALRLESVTVRRGVDQSQGDEAQGDAAAVVATWGEATGPPRTVPLVHRGAMVGSLDVTAPPGESLGGRSMKSLAELASVVAAGIALQQASADLRDARDRLSSVRLEERRVIRRELHDGLGPSLAGIRLGLQGVRNLLPNNPAAAAELLESLQRELDFSVDGVRSLSRTLFPPVLEELGLGAALAELSNAHGRSGFTIDVHCELTNPGFSGRLDPAIEADAYGIISEAVSNVRRHSGVDRAVVDVRYQPGSGRRPTIVLTVTDAGKGIEPDAKAGIGTRSMRERAEGHDGSLEIGQREGGGTVVRAELGL